MKKLIATAAAAAFLIGTGVAMADSAGGDGPKGSTGTTANAPSQPDNAKTPAMKAAPGATTGAGMEDKDAKKGNVSAKSPADSKTIPNVK
jgi:hypothetical protein